MTRREIRKTLARILREEKFSPVEGYECIYLGSFTDLDPCGRFHHILSPNGITKRCIRFWDNLEECAQELGCWIEAGEWDGTDIFLCRPLD